jgi:hypothetical protein
MRLALAPKVAVAEGDTEVDEAAAEADKVAAEAVDKAAATVDGGVADEVRTKGRPWFDTKN